MCDSHSIHVWLLTRTAAGVFFSRSRAGLILYTRPIRYRAWRWNQLHRRTPAAIAMASVVFAAASFTVLFLVVHESSLMFAVLLGFVVLHTLINFVLSVVAWRDRPWSDLRHPGLLWAVVMRVFASVGFAMLFVEGNKAHMYIAPLLTCALLLALLLLLQFVAFMLPLVVAVALVAVDFAMLATISVFEVRLGWHDEAYIAAVIGWYVGPSDYRLHTVA